jgi:hypothetical protein
MKPLPYTLRATWLAAALLLCALGGGVARAQTAAPTPTPTEEELRLQEQKRLLELQRDIELAKKAIRDAQPQPAAAPAPPTPTTTPLAGDTTLEGVKLESEMVTYAAMSMVVDAIADEVRSRVGAADRCPPQQIQPCAPPPAVAIYDAQVVKDWRYYQALFPAFEGQVKDLFKSYAKLLCESDEASPDFKTKYGFCDNNNKARAIDPNRELGPQLLAVTGAVSSAFGAGTNLLKTFVDAAALFRTDTKITGNAVTVEESALVAEIFRALRNKYSASHQEIYLYYPEVFPPRLDLPDTEQNRAKYNRTVTTIGTLFLAKIEADRVIAALGEEKEGILKKPLVKNGLERLGKLNADLASVKALTFQRTRLEQAFYAETDPVVKERIKKEIGEVGTALAKLNTQSWYEAEIANVKSQLALDTTRVDEIDENVKSLSDLNKRFQTFVDEFVKVNSTGVNALSLFVKAEDIENVMRESNSYWLEIKSVSAGGNNRVRKNLLRYFTGAKVDHSGGVIIEYTLYNREGRVVYSDKFSYYGDYVEPKNIRNLRDQVRP